MAKFDYDLIIIGGGAAGITAARMAQGLGKKVAILDRGKFGGECTWSGCIPSKSLLKAAQIAHHIAQSRQYGLSFQGKYSLNTHQVIAQVQERIAHIYKSETPQMFHKDGITTFENSKVSFIDNHTVHVNKKKLTSSHYIITTGSDPFIPPVQGLENTTYHTNNSIFSLKKLPSSMIIMGGGPIGVELATAFNRLGVAITLIDMADRILIHEDHELVTLLTECLKKEGITIITHAVVEKITGPGSIRYRISGKSHNLNAEILLIATGRKPNIEGLELGKIGIAYTSKGIKVNKYLQTSVKNIYAAGDVTGVYQFSHMANYQAVIATSNALLPIRRSVSYTHVPWCIFSDPELAHSGLTEEEARSIYGKRTRIYRSDYSQLDRAITDRTGTGLAKFVCTKNNKILGIHILGERAAEIMQEAHLAKVLGIPLHSLENVIHCYPSYAEVIKKAAKDAYIQKLRNNFFIKLFTKIKGKR